MPQQLAHATVNGASIRTGDLMASGTISGPERGSEGSLIELTRNGAEPVSLGAGGERTFLEDGDEVVLRGRAANGVELGEVRGRIAPARCRRCGRPSRVAPVRVGLRRRGGYALSTPS